MAWLNNDGLYIKFGREEGEAGIVGEFVPNTNVTVAEFTLDLTTLGTSATSADAILDDNYIIPKGVRILRVETVVEDGVTTSDSANWNLGLYTTDNRTVFDADALVAAGDGEVGAAEGTITVYEQGSTEHGAELGEVTAEPYHLSAYADTGTFSAGTLTVRVYFSRSV